MRRLIIKIMVLFLLLSSFAWAAEMDESLTAFQQNHEINNQNSSANPTHSFCDECCHGGVHLFAVFSEAVVLPSVLKGRHKPVSVRHRYFITRQPPTPPPTA